MAVGLWRGERLCFYRIIIRKILFRVPGILLPFFAINICDHEAIANKLPRKYNRRTRVQLHGAAAAATAAGANNIFPISFTVRVRFTQQC